MSETEPSVGERPAAAPTGSAGDEQLATPPPADDGARKRRAKKSKSGDSSGNSPFELVLIVAVALGLALGIQAFLVKPYRIPSESMVPTLEIGQRVLVNRIGNRFGDPEHRRRHGLPSARAAPRTRTSAAIQHKDDQPCPMPTKTKADVNFIKRIVAGPGDTLAIVDGHAVLNGKRQKEPFIRDCQGGEQCNFPTPITIPPDHYFMMGDNRGASDDSRYWGPVPRKWIIGNAFATYWPPKRIGPL